MGGHIDANTHHPAETKAGSDAGKLRVLATMGPKRSNLYPDVPTMQELGHDWVVSQWRGIAMPKGVSEDVQKAWADALQQVCDDPEFQKFITERMGGTVAPLFGADLDAFLSDMANVFITTAQNLQKDQ
jgi:tripartite-type tricarboxylate transporter receptor subunit TctC